MQDPQDLKNPKDPKMMRRGTRFGSLEHFEKGGVEVINDDARNYVFSNIFEVASKSEPYEKVAVGKNLKYVLEAIRAEGTSPWYTASHDESAHHHGRRSRDPPRQARHGRLVAERARGHHDARGRARRASKMGYIVARRGHMALLPKGAAYQFHARKPGVILLQTIAGRSQRRALDATSARSERPSARRMP